MSVLREEAFELRGRQFVTGKNSLQVRRSQVLAGNLAKDIAEVGGERQVPALVQLIAL